MKVQKKFPVYLLGIIFSLELSGATPDGAALRIDAAQIEVKANGVLVHLSTNGPINLVDITGWIQGKEWFYLTILEATSDTVALGSTPLASPVSQLQAVNLPQSTQIALHLERPVDHFEIFQSSDPTEILISLRYPVSEVLALLDTVSKEKMLPISEPTLYPKIRKALYLTGTFLTIGGIVIRSGEKNENTTLFLGMGILVGTYLYDAYIRPRRDHGETLTILRSILRRRATFNGPFLPDKIPSHKKR
ncbi:MAG: hypothetical protein ACE5DP_02725 [Fidelibacterota bacterium]